MPNPQHAWTRAEVLALPDDGMLHQQFDGELVVTPGPRRTHEIVGHRLYDMLHPNVTAHGLGNLLKAIADLPLRGAARERTCPGSGCRPGAGNPFGAVIVRDVPPILN